MKEIVLITLHGMGRDGGGAEALGARLGKLMGARWSRVAFHPVDYASLLQAPQDSLWQAMTQRYALDSAPIRTFLLHYLGDAGSLEFSAHREPASYLAVQTRLHQALLAAWEACGQRSCPVVILAHSLGAQVISNYLWDAQHRQYLFANAPEHMSQQESFGALSSLRRLITTGCNIPLFTSGLKERHCFTRQPSDLIWDNYYDRDDPLGWPLRPLGSSYEWINDKEINVGGVFSAWNPASHTHYWDDEDLLRPLADALNARTP